LLSYVILSRGGVILKNLQQEIYKNQKIIIYAVIACCVIFTDYHFFLRSLIAGIQQRSPQLKQLKRRLDTANNNVASIPRYENQIKELQETLSSYNKKFSTQQQISSLLQELSDMAKDSGVRITSVKPHSAVLEAQQGAVTAYKKFPISISATCGYHQLGIFINKVENSDTFMRVADITITANSNTPASHIVNMVINTYILTDLN
jgi:type IV pilus assembly protein PilO